MSFTVVLINQYHKICNIEDENNCVSCVEGQRVTWNWADGYQKHFCSISSCSYKALQPIQGSGLLN
jgi:hypothetical protein